VAPTVSPYCRTPLSAAPTFCPSCGKRLKRSSGAALSTRRWTIIIATVVVVGVLAGVVIAPTPVHNALFPSSTSSSNGSPGGGGNPTENVTVDAVHLVIHQGNTSGGQPWLGPGSIYYDSTNSNYPQQIAPGGSWTVDWSFINFDNHYHNITGAIPKAPFTLGSTMPTIPVQLPPNAESLGLAITVVTPNTPGATYPLVTIVIVVN